MSHSQIIAVGTGSKARGSQEKTKPIFDTLEARLMLSVTLPASGTNVVPTPIGVIVPPTVGPIGVGVTILATVGQPFSGDVGLIKGLTLSATNTTKYQTTISWGDGSAAGTGTLKVDSTGLVHVQGTHTRVWDSIRSTFW